MSGVSRGRGGPGVGGGGPGAGAGGGGATGAGARGGWRRRHRCGGGREQVGAAAATGAGAAGAGRGRGYGGGRGRRAGGRGRGGGAAGRGGGASRLRGQGPRIRGPGRRFGGVGWWGWGGLGWGDVSASHGLPRVVGGRGAGWVGGGLELLVQPAERIGCVLDAFAHGTRLPFRRLPVTRHGATPPLRVVARAERPSAKNLPIHDEPGAGSHASVVRRLWIRPPDAVRFRLFDCNTPNDRLVGRDRVATGPPHTVLRRHRGAAGDRGHRLRLAGGGPLEPAAGPLRAGAGPPLGHGGLRWPGSSGPTRP